MKQLPVSEYPEAWQLIVQAFLQMKYGFKAPKGWERNELLARSITVPAVLLGESNFRDARGCLEDPLARQKCCTAAGPRGLLPIAAPPGPELPKHKQRAPPEEWQLHSENPGELWRECVCGETAPCAGRCGGKSCWERGL